MDFIENHNNVLFSVIIPHYNCVDCLNKLIDTIPLDESIQLIVVDDKSEEDVSSVEKKVLSRGGVFIYNTTDRKGAGTCRNFGLKEAIGKWIVFADADDYFLENAFGIMATHSNSEADIIYFIPISKYINTERMAKRHEQYAEMVRQYLHSSDLEREIILRYKFITPWSKMIRNQLVLEKKIMFDEVPAGNDLMFSVKTAFYAKEIEAFPDQVYCVTQSAGTLTTKHDTGNYWSRVEAYARRYKFMQQFLDVQKFGYAFPMGIKMLIDAIKQGYNIGFVAKIYFYFRKEHIKLFSWRVLKYKIQNTWCKSNNKIEKTDIKYGN